MWGVGGGGNVARLFLLFSFPCSADHERDWPPCKVFFFGLATDTLNVRNNKQQHLLIAMQGHQTKTKQKHFEYIIK